MKKVLHILYSLLPSGAETMLVNSSQEWYGWEKHVLATAYDIGTYADEFKRAGYVVHHIGTKNQYVKHKAICKLIQRERYNVVHIHTEASSFRYAFDAKISGCECIVRTVHNVFISHKRNLLVRQLARIRRGTRRHLETALLGVKYIAIGNSVYENELNQYNNRCTIIRNWCDEKIFSETTEDEYQTARYRLDIKPTEFCILTVGNCSLIKNHKMLLNALSLIINNAKGLQIIYMHVGSGNDEASERELAHHLNLASMVHFEGQCDPALYYRAADIFVMPSEFEGMGISALEAAFTGIPLILTETEGLRDFKELKSRDVQYVGFCEKELADKLYDSYCRFNKYGWLHSKELSEKARNIYSMKKSVQQYILLYES